MSGNVPTQDLASRAPWCYNILDTVRRLPYEISSDWPTFHERLKKRELKPDEEKSSVTFGRESEAQEHVVVDLALSCDVFSPQPIKNPHSTDTEPCATPGETPRGSFSEEPPEVQFGYFHPDRQIGANHMGRETSVSLSGENTTTSSPLGVRLLLAEWDIGADVENYVYIDPYDTTESVGVPVPPRRKQGRSTIPTVPQTVVPKQRPPTVVAAAATQPDWKLFCTENSNSQKITPNPNSDNFSQGLMPSTQVLPGPYGGRPGAGKKKPIKKRIGGF